MRTRKRENAVAVLTAMSGVVLLLTAAAWAAEPSTFERSVIKGGLDQAAKDYYAAVWTSLAFFHGTDSARALLAPFNAMTQQREVDSIINVLFLPLDSDPIAPGNSFLQGLTEKIDFCRNRGFLHTGGPYLSHVFDDIGVLILVNGLPSWVTVLDQPPVKCGRRLQFPVPQYSIGWQQWGYSFQEDCFGYWRIVGGDDSAMRAFNEQLIGGVAVFDPDVPLNEGSVIARPVAILDSTDWQSEWTVANLGLRAKDFVRDSSGWKRLQMHGALSVATSGSDQPSLVDSVSLDMDLGREKPGREDLVALQRVEKPGGDHGDVRGRALGVDISNPKDKHWKKSIPFPVGWSDGGLTIGYGWLLNPKVVNANYIGGRPPLIHDVVVQADSLLLFFQLTGVTSDLEGRFRTHVKLRFIRDEEREWEVILSKLYRLGKEPRGSTQGADIVSAAAEMGVVEMSSPAANVTFCTRVPSVREGRYKIVGECYRTTGTDPRPFAMIMFSDVQIKERENQAAK